MGNDKDLVSIDISMKKEMISLLVIKILCNRFSTFPKNDGSVVRNAPFHKAFLNAFKEEIKAETEKHDIPFLISLSSWLHGLNTTLGQTFFEGAAHILSDGCKKAFKDNNLIYSNQKRKVFEIITELKNGNKNPNLKREDKELFNIDQDSIEEKATDFTADVFIEEDENIWAIEMKSVRPNSGEIKGEKQKILEAKAVLFNMFPGKKIHYFVGFPFDPTSDDETSYDKGRFLAYLIEAKKFLDPEEILLADELWMFLSNHKINMKELLDIINDIATPEFLDNFRLVNTSNDHCEIISILEKWHLKTEIEFLSQKPSMQKHKSFYDQFKRAIKSPAFNSKAEYNTKRHTLLREWVSINSNSTTTSGNS